MSAMPLIATMERTCQHVSNVPLAEVAALFDHLRKLFHFFPERTASQIIANVIMQQHLWYALSSTIVRYE